MKKSIQQSLFEPLTEPEVPAPWEEAAEKDRLIAQVVLNRPLEMVFEYLVPGPLREIICPGQRVKVPFGRGNQVIVGYCVGLSSSSQASTPLKAIHSVLDREPLLTSKMLELTRWIAQYYLCGWGQALNTVIPAGVKKRAGTRLVQFYLPRSGVASELANLELPPKQKAVLETLCLAGRALRVDELTEAVGCGMTPITGLRQKGLIQAIQQRTDSFEDPEAILHPEEPDLVLNEDQRKALDVILSELRSARHRTLLLHGVTGSGKTEVYIQAIREVVSYGRQAIVLVPEISLTPQTIRRFRSRFPSVAVLHSHLSDAERHRQWQQIARGGVQVVVGARSAVFAPAPYLGLIVIDEEHETTFKQETAPRYQARDVARQRARLEGIPLVLGTATPTLESWRRVHDNEDVLISLPRRVAGLPLPPVSVVDIRNDPHFSRGRAIGRALRSAIQIALSDGGQVILFLNVRGFSLVLWCVSCGESVKCPSCDITLTWHKDRKSVMCHFCEYQAPPPGRCPHCGHEGLRYLGTGTQKLEEEVRALFPGAKCARMDSDSMKKHGSHDEVLEAFRRGDIRILLGTQMIAKGLDFPNVTLVGVVNADTMLHQPDLRAAERTFQLIAQVAGRTGRSAKGGRVLVQTSCPAEPAILHAAQHDYIRFAERELRNRREMDAPPFHHFARVILRGRDESRVKQGARDLAEVLRQEATDLHVPVRILGPAPAPIARQKHYYRYHLQLAAEQTVQIHQLWRHAADKLPKTLDVEHVIDVDAINMR